MQSYLIAAKDKKAALKFVELECKNNKIGKFDLSIYSFDKMVGIDDVRQIQKKLMLKPMMGKDKAIILETYNGITIEAQNGLLKVLEEPPNHTIIYITIQNKDLLLPTILSRCKIIELKNEASEVSEEEKAQYLNILGSLSKLGIGEKLKLAQDIAKNKGDASLWFEKMIMVGRQLLIENNYKYYNNYNFYNILASLNKTYTIIKTTNANQRLLLENLFLNL